MYCYKAFGLNIHSEIPLPELSDGDPDSATDLSIKLGKITLPDLEQTRIFRRGTEALFGQNDNGDLFLHWPKIGSFQAIDSNTLIVSPDTSDNNIISLFTVSETLGLILFQRGYFLLHASSVLVGDEAWCFMGDPGAGKSTTAAAFIKAGCKLLSDDLTAIQLDAEGKPYVVPAYPQLKIWDNAVIGLNYDRSVLHPVSEGVNKFAFQSALAFSQEKVKLRKVFFLHKARNKKSLQRMQAGEIPGQMLKNFPLPTSLLKGESLKRHFIQSFQCAGSAEVWQKRRPDGFDNLENWVTESISQSAKTLVHE